MSNTAYIGRQMRSFDSAPEFDGFSKVVIQVSDEVEYTAGNDAGRTLTLINPWGTQAMANRILAKIKGFQYQPYTAEGARLDPAAELGDAVTVNSMHGGIFTRRETFGPLMSSTVSAPEDEEIDHEYQYVSKQDRVIKRNIRELTAELKVQAGLISAEVAERKSAIEEAYAALKIQSDRITQEVTDRKKDVQTLTATLTTQAGQIDAKVSKTGGNASSFGWTLTDSDWTIKSNGSTILKATKAGLEITGKVTATSGKIGGFDILSNYLSYNGQTWGGTNTYGAYLGNSGLQLGQNFRVDMAGNLYAQSGTFAGSVYAGNIKYGETGGYFSGYGIAGGTVTGDTVAGYTLSTYNMTSGITSSLAQANAAYNVCYGNVKASALSASALAGDTINGTRIYAGYLYIGGEDLYLGTIRDYEGDVRRVVMW